MQINLSACPPFSFSSVVRSHGWIQLAPFSSEDHNNELRYIDRLESGRVLEYRIHPAPDGISMELQDDLTSTEYEEAARKVTWMLGLDMDFSEFYALARSEPKLAHLEPNAHGRVLRSPTLFEDVVKTMLTVNTSWSGTRRMVQNLVSLYGEALPSDSQRRSFPSPASLAVLAEEDLRNQARLGFRSPFVLGLARAVHGGDVDLETLKTDHLPSAELRKRLLGIKGVGAYAVANLLNILGCYDSIPIDSWALKMVSQEWHQGEPVGPAEVEAAFELWGEWKGLAYWFWAWNQ